jgi:hypothetical protein
MSRTTAALDLLDSFDAGAIAHPGGDLRSHLIRTHDQLRSWSAPDDVCLAGLCHAAYGTDGFPRSLLSLDERPRLRAVVGDGAEAIVHTYCSCAREATYARLGERPLRLTDRFAGEVRPLPDDETAAFALITVANELDIVRVGQFDATAMAAITGLIEAMAPYVPTAAATALAEIRSHV